MTPSLCRPSLLPPVPTLGEQCQGGIISKNRVSSSLVEGRRHENGRKYAAVGSTKEGQGLPSTKIKSAAGKITGLEVCD